MVKFYFLFCILVCIVVFSCKSSSEKNAVLPILDLSKEYPVKVLDATELADVEYVPLETNEHSIYMPSPKYLISEDYIITSNTLGEVLVFNRQGKFLWRFNHRGPGPEEYTSVLALAVDFNVGELFLCDQAERMRLKVYSLEGKYKRTLFISGDNERVHFQELYDYDKNYLIGYSSSWYYTSQLKDNRKNFSLIDKQTGEQKIINFPGGKFMNLWLFEGGVAAMKNDMMVDRYPARLNRLIRNGSEFLFAESANDTLYSFKEGTLTPIAVQTPSVYNNPDTPLVISPTLYTDNYLVFNIVPMNYDAKPWETDQIDYLWDRRTGEIVRGMFHFPDFNPKVHRFLPINYNEFFVGANYAISWINAEALLKLNKAGVVSGRLKDIASTLKEDDNNVLIICEFK